MRRFLLYEVILYGNLNSVVPSIFKLLSDTASWSLEVFYKIAFLHLCKIDNWTINMRNFLAVFFLKLCQRSRAIILQNNFFQNSNFCRTYLIVLPNCYCTIFKSYSPCTIIPLRLLKKSNKRWQFWTKVISIKLALTDWFFYNLIMLIKLCKIWSSKLRQSSIISEKPSY